MTEQLKEAMRSKNERATGTIRMMMAKLKERDIDARAANKPDGISDDEMLSLFQGMIKQRRESIELYNKGGRPELAQQESEEIAVIETFLPKQMSDDEIRALIAKMAADMGIKEAKDMGRLMGELKKNYAGQMDMSKASAMAKQVIGAAA
ncbi:MAG: GatB/YqeY domain-containing protein [Alphaproteobacteria bacterium]|nr:GatB/YqeY domain-containing protein [Alphaproteobacteria bacterium]NDG04184.1 GatB/YqeY domain-containing protein [Alphaproteobacteria bacterium]